MSHHGRRVFIVGPGFIGINVLELLVAEGYQVSALVRHKEAGEDIKAANAEPIIGELDDAETIIKHTVLSDVVIHCATADHLPSAQAILDGIIQRAEKELPTIYLHNSGASVFDDGANGEYKTDKIYSDEKQGEIDAVSDDAPHRKIDLAILKVRNQVGKKAKIAILVPPLIYGFVSWHPRLSIQIPGLTRFAIKQGYSGHLGKGKSVISTVHVRDLAKAYLTILHHLEKTPGGSADIHNPYYFIENTGDNEPSWKDIADTIAEGLHKGGKLDAATVKEIPESSYKDLFFGIPPEPIFGLNTRTRADRLAKLGWKPTHKDWRSSYLEDELPELLKE